MNDPGFLEQMRMAGAPAHLALLLAFVASCVGGVGLVLATQHKPVGRMLGLAALGAAFVVVLLGFGGRALGMRQVEAALQNVNPADRAPILAEGSKEAGMNVSLAGEFAVLPALLGLAAAALGGTKKPEAAG